MADRIIPCQCTGCGDPHAGGEPKDSWITCPNPANWYIEMHPVDHCQAVKVVQGGVCHTCFGSQIEYIKMLLAWSAAGRRAQHCLGCERPIASISDVITDIAKL